MKASENLSSSAFSENLDTIIQALSNDTRQKLLISLAEGPLTYTQILEKLNLESGSFYWHLKKMKILIAQTEDRHYKLSKLGTLAFELLSGNMQSGDDITFNPDWYLKIKENIGKIAQIPTWLIYQQIIVLIALVAFLYREFQFIQLGVLVISTPQPLLFILTSILISAGFLVSCLVLITQVLFSDNFRKKFPNRSRVIIFVSRLFLTTSTSILLTGIIIGIFSLIGGVRLGFNPFIQFFAALLGLLVTITTTIALIDHEVELGFKDSTILVLFVYYPLVLLSFLIAESF